MPIARHDEVFSALGWTRTPNLLIRSHRALSAVLAVRCPVSAGAGLSAVLKVGCCPNRPHTWVGAVAADRTDNQPVMAYAAAGAGYLASAGWWPGLTLAASVASIALLVLYLSRYWVIGIGVSISLAVVAWRSLEAANGAP